MGSCFFAPLVQIINYKKVNNNHKSGWHYGIIKRILCPWAGKDKGDVKYEIF